MPVVFTQSSKVDIIEYGTLKPLDLKKQTKNFISKFLPLNIPKKYNIMFELN